MKIALGISGLIVAFGVTTTPAAAQRPVSPFASIRGYVFDSLLSNAILPGAHVAITGPMTRTATTDQRGRFDVDSLTPGKYVISFGHPSLDGVGYAAPERTVDLPAGVVTRLFLSTTAGHGIFARLCPNVKEAQTGVVLGQLSEVVGNRPIAGGEVRVEWNESVVSKELGLSNHTRAVRSVTDSVGRYTICGIPNDVGVLLRARARGLEGPPLELQLESRPLAIRMLTMDLGDSATRVAANKPLDHGSAVLKGTIRQDDGKPITEAQVLVLGLPNGARSTPSGAFELTGLPGGTHSVEIRAIGFNRRREMVNLVPDQAVELNVKMARMAVVLPEVTVNSRPTAASEFDSRKGAGAGHFITQDDIERRNPLRTEDLFRTVPGFSVVPSGGFDYSIVSTRGAGMSGQCSPDFYLDGAKITVDPQIGGGLPVNPGEIYGIEAYGGSASVPAQYMSQSGCGTVLIWTRRGAARRR